MIHGLISLLVATVLSFISPWLAFLPAAFYLGREHSEAEYRYMSKHKTNRENSPWYMGFLPESWTLDGVLDCAIPAVVCFVVFFLLILEG